MKIGWVEREEIMVICHYVYSLLFMALLYKNSPCYMFYDE